jgi:hypothetical protein
MQGIAQAKHEGKYRGRPEDRKRNTAIMNMLKRGMSWDSIIEAASGSGKKLSRATLSKLARRMREAAQARSTPALTCREPFDRVPSIPTPAQRRDESSRNGAHMPAESRAAFSLATRLAFSNWAMAPSTWRTRTAVGVSSRKKSGAERLRVRSIRSVLAVQSQGCARVRRRRHHEGRRESGNGSWWWKHAFVAGLLGETPPRSKSGRGLYPRLSYILAPAEGSRNKSMLLVPSRPAGRPTPGFDRDRPLYPRCVPYRSR